MKSFGQLGPVSRAFRLFDGGAPARRGWATAAGRLVIATRNVVNRGLLRGGTAIIGLGS